MDEGQKFHRDNVPAARRLRRPMTATEALLWEHLRDRKFRNLKFRRQHPIGPYVADFFCSELRLVLEIDGGVHNQPEQRLRDREREFYLEGLGLRVVRLSNSQVDAGIEQAMHRALEEGPTLPLLPPQWEKGEGMRAHRPATPALRHPPLPPAPWRSPSPSATLPQMPATHVAAALRGHRWPAKRKQRA